MCLICCGSPLRILQKFHPSLKDYALSHSALFLKTPPAWSLTSPQPALAQCTHTQSCFTQPFLVRHWQASRLTHPPHHCQHFVQRGKQPHICLRKNFQIHSDLRGEVWIPGSLTAVRPASARSRRTEPVSLGVFKQAEPSQHSALCTHRVSCGLECSLPLTSLTTSTCSSRLLMYTPYNSSNHASLPEHRLGQLLPSLCLWGCSVLIC